MKNLKLKSTLGMIVLSIFFIFTNTNSVSAQYNSRGYAKKGKRSVKVRNNRSAYRNTRFVSVPRNARLINHRNIEYRYYQGTFYRPYGNGFIISTPPIGIRINTLPYGCNRVYRNGVSYYSVGNTYYRPIQTRGGVSYEVVRI